jgi:hypothetical protein
MRTLHERIRGLVGRETPLIYLVLNVGPDRLPVAPAAQELNEWERFVDSLADPHSETCGYQAPQEAL